GRYDILRMESEMLAALMRWTTVLSCAVLFCAGLPIGGAVAQPPEAPPKAFLDNIYKAYVGKKAKGIVLKDNDTIKRYFAVPLANAIIKDRADAAKRGDVPTLDGDPFVDAQDWDIEKYSINVKMNGSTAAVGTVDFANAGQAVTMTLDLVRPTGTWHIADI